MIHLNLCIADIDTYDQDGFDEDEAQEIINNNNPAAGAAHDKKGVAGKQGDALDLGDEYEDDEDEDEGDDGNEDGEDGNDAQEHETHPSQELYSHGQPSDAAAVIHAGVNPYNEGEPGGIQQKP